MKNRNMIFDFTQCYPKRKEPGLEWHDCSAIGGSRLYCSRDAEEKIKALIAPGRSIRNSFYRFGGLSLYFQNYDGFYQGAVYAGVN